MYFFIFRLLNLFLPEFLNFLNLLFLIACHIICQYLQSLCLTVSLNFDVEFKNSFECTQLNKQTNSEARRIKVYHRSSLHQDICDFWASTGITIYKHFNDFT